MNAGHPTGGSPIGSQVTYFKFDEQQGQTTNNTITSAGNGTLGADSGSSTDDPTWKTKSDCKINGCLSFDGGDRVSVSSQFSSWADNVSTLTGWVKVTSYDTFGFVLFGTSTGNDVYWQIASDTTVYVMTQSITVPSTNFDDNSWHHYAFVSDGTNGIKFYFDGKLLGSNTLTGISFSSGAKNFNIGTWDLGASWDLTGSVDELKLYNSALTEDQVRIDMNAGSAVKYSVGQDEAADLTDGAGNPPVLEMKLDEKTGTTTNSTSGTFTGTLTSGPTWVAGKYGSAVNFDGSDDFIDIGTGTTSVQSVAFWIYPATTTEYPIDINGTAYVWINAGTVTAQGFTSPTIYVNGVVSSTVTANSWQHIEVTTGTALNASDFDIGRIEGVGNHEGKIDQVVLYDYARTAGQVAYDYNRGAPIGWWKLDECQGTTAYDSGNPPTGGNNGTITIGASGTEDTVGTCNTSSTSWGSGSSGKYSASLDFDGTDDYIDTGSSSFNFTTQPFSVSAWVYSDDLGSGVNAEIVATDKANSPASGWGFLLVGPSEILRLVTRGTTPSNIDSVSSVPINTWSHVAATFSGTSGTMALYINGVLNNSTSYTGSITSAACNLQIGRRFRTSCAATAVYFNGKIDDVRVYNYALSAAQVRKVHNEGSAVRYGN